VQSELIPWYRAILVITAIPRNGDEVLRSEVLAEDADLETLHRVIGDHDPDQVFQPGDQWGRYYIEQKSPDGWRFFKLDSRPKVEPKLRPRITPC